MCRTQNVRRATEFFSDATAVALPREATVNRNLMKRPSLPSLREEAPKATIRRNSNPLFRARIGMQKFFGDFTHDTGITDESLKKHILKNALVQ
mmetsp:Transcript_62003/g.71090  ORF Transcript_62003/g.71090 Transcript_62003/m.71090 type:complete len:94 (-) Transcript_62003:362-643(-)